MPRALPVRNTLFHCSTLAMNGPSVFLSTSYRRKDGARYLAELESLGLAGLRVLHRWTLHRAVGTEDATIAWLRPQTCATSFALVEEDAFVRGHEFHGGKSAVRAGYGGLKDRHLSEALPPNKQRSCAELTPTFIRASNLEQAAVV